METETTYEELTKMIDDAIKSAKEAIENMRAARGLIKDARWM